MKEKFQQLPSVLQKQLITRMTFGTIILILTMVILFFTWDLFLFLPSMLLSVYIITNSCILLFRYIKENYITVQGVCFEIETKGIRKRIKSFYMTSEKKTLRIPIWQRIRHLRTGDTVIIYLSEKAPIYECDSIFTICSYYALHIQGKEG